MSIFDIIGPIMIGPSSSHTAGAVRIGSTARRLFGKPPRKATITLYGSFAKAGRGHGTDKALIAGLCGLEMDDERVRDAFDLCDFEHEFLTDDNEDYHPNTVLIELQSESEKMKVRACSVGGGRIEIGNINDMPVSFSDNGNTLILFHKDKPGVLASVTKRLSDSGINIAFMHVFRLEKGLDAITVIETDTAISEVDRVMCTSEANKVIWFEKKQDMSDDERMLEALSVMRRSIDNGLRNSDKTASGMVGGDAYLMKKAMDAGIVPGDLSNRAALYSMAVAQTNARMGRIVAAPTAGAAGIIPGVLIALGEINGYGDSALADALFVAGNVGMHIARYATLSGAKGGCQAECGSAAAMAAAAMVFLHDGDEDMRCHAAALALKSTLGLVCDPVAGLVEVPCVKRSANLTSIAITSANMALCGIKSVIPFDEVVGAMKQVGYALPQSLKETAEGGLAATPTGREINQRLGKH